MITGAPWHYADRNLAIGLILILALLAGAALAWTAISHKKGGKR